MKKLICGLLLIATSVTVNFSNTALACTTQNSCQGKDCYNPGVCKDINKSCELYGIPNFEIPNFEIPSFEMPNFEVPNVELPATVIPGFIFESYEDAAQYALDSARLYKGYIGIYDFRYIESNDNISNKENVKYEVPITGDIINKKYDEITGISETYVLSQRNNNPSLLTRSYPDNTLNVTITADGDTCIGEEDSLKWGVIIGDDKSSINIELKNSSSMAYTINGDNKASNISLTIDKTSQWYVTGTSYINELVIHDNNLANIIDNGNTIYYDADNIKNSWLDGKTIVLSGGGKLEPRTSHN